ncbi:MAG TPA: bifunctional adenosylcobinamide kinase/adenosylcobinamide-phosphate guanylyltransferase [Steroidobacteraceae bacterium]|jgi:adenosylcobinamide kinase/adenosylcobinamide-phosphate guanylyltransferase|nr:bifunctional adenosylcobinamide kinase/adenosylcobinamide-phosphate guanylyltransferase [Steroidobacteraceae bacterium]
MRTFLLGGARSGKSSLAARWAAERSKNVCCVVTATASDDEMTARIDAHRRERPQHWRLREEPRRLSAAVRDESRAGGLLLIDCLTLWTANCLWPPASAAAVTSEASGDFQADLPGWHAERDAFLTSLLTASSEIIIVSNEVGTSLVPENAAARLFRDEQGRLNQLVAAACDAVFLVTAGLPLRLK